jgi:hypothetical protein
MPLPDWGRSYNALSVPLTSDWQCSLLLARDVEEPSSWWQLTYAERQQKRKDREKQIEVDRGDFLRLFRVSLSKREALFSSDFRAYVDFIGNTLRSSTWDIPVDGDGVVRVLCAAVRDGRVVAVIDRAWRGSRRVTRSYAPQSWPKRLPDPKPIVYSVRNGEFVPLDATGRFIDITPYVPVAARISAAASSADNSGSSFDWLGVVETGAGAMLGGDTESSGDSAVSDDFGAGAGIDSTPLRDAQPFEYMSDSLSDDVMDFAARGVSEAEEAECGALYERDMEECNFARAIYQDPRTYALCTQRAFSNFQSCRGY